MNGRLRRRAVAVLLVPLRQLLQHALGITDDPVVPGPRPVQQPGHECHLAVQNGAVDQMGVEAAAPRCRVLADDDGECLGVGPDGQPREVLRRVRHAGARPVDDRAHVPPVDQDPIGEQFAVHRAREEPPPRHVLDPCLPPLQQRRRDGTRLGSPVEGGKAPSAQALAVVHGDTDGHERVGVDAVDGSHRARHRAGQCAVGAERGERQGRSAQGREHHRPAATGQRRVALRARDGERRAVGQHVEDRHLGLELGPGSAPPRRGDHPVARRVVPDDRGVHTVARRPGGHDRDRAHVRDGGHPEGGQLQGSPGAAAGRRRSDDGRHACHRTAAGGPYGGGVPRSDVADSIGPADPVLPDLALSRARHDRMAESRSVPGLMDSLLADPDTDILLVHAATVPVVDGPDGTTRLALVSPVNLANPSAGATGAAAALPDGTIPVLLGRLDGRMVVAALLPVTNTVDAWGGSPEGGSPAPPVEGARWAGLRQVGTLLPDGDVGLAVEAVGLDGWHRTHPCCPRCGTPTVPAAAGHERRCTADGSSHHPRSDPAVIMAVVDPDDRLLLARQVTWPDRRYSLLAGFVEPGESLEAAVARETAEEAGVVVDHVRYLGSQPWPFPASLMVGFAARARSTDITVDGVEIAEALWVSGPELQAALADGTIVLPPPLSIARQIIEWWAGGALSTEDTWR